MPRLKGLVLALWASAPAVAAQSGPDPWRARTVPLAGASYAPDIGLLVGVGVAHTRYGFHALPPSTRLLAQVGCATEARACRLDVHGEFRRPLMPTILSVVVRWSGLEALRFFGLGNEAPARAADSVYRVREEQLVVAPEVSLPLAPGLRLTTGPLLKRAHTPADSGTLLATTGPWYGAGDFGQVGAGALLELDTRDLPAAPARGAHLAIGAQGYPAAWDVRDPFARVMAEASAYVSGDDPGAVVLALRAGGATVAGTVPFQELVYIGGEATVRGYAEHRFAGRRGAYANAEVRLLVGRLEFGDLGVLGLGDVGRVWSAGTASDLWHAAVGGGVWVAWHHRRINTLSVVVARSPEHTALYARAGFSF